MGNIKEAFDVDSQPSADSVYDIMQGFVNCFALRPATLERWTVDNVAAVVGIGFNDYSKGPVSGLYACFITHSNHPFSNNAGKEKQT